MKSDIDFGNGSRHARFKRDTIPAYIQIYDEDRTDPVELYRYLMNQVGKKLRKELSITNRDVSDED